MGDVRKFSRLTPGILPSDTTAAQPQDLPQIATIVRADTSGAYFTLTVSPGHMYGPAPWSLGSYVTVAASISGGGYPHAGDAALVVFAGSGVGRPVVLAWWR